MIKFKNNKRLQQCVCSQVTGDITSLGRYVFRHLIIRGDLKDVGQGCPDPLLNVECAASIVPISLIGFNRANHNLHSCKLQKKRVFRMNINICLCLSSSVESMLASRAQDREFNPQPRTLATLEK